MAMMINMMIKYMYAYITGCRPIDLMRGRVEEVRGR